MITIMMRTIVTKILAVALLAAHSFSVFACSNNQRTCNLSYFLTDYLSGESSDKLYVGRVYELQVNYLIDSQNSRQYTFTSFINANDNVVVSYLDGPQCLINGNIIEVKYSGGDSVAFKSAYKLDVRSAGTSYLRFKDIENIVIEPAEIALEAFEK